MFLQTTSGLSYREDGRGEPLLLVNGTLLDKSFWDSQVQVLSRRWRVIRLSLHATSPGHSENMHVREIMSLLRDLQITTCRIVGHGTGAFAAASLARQNPGMVSRLILIDPIVRRTELNHVQEIWHLESLLQWLEVGYGPQVRSPETLAMIKQAISQQCIALFGGVAAGAIHRPDFRLPSTFESTPILVLIGELETEESIEIARMLFGQGTEGRFMLVPGASRHSPVEASSFVTAELSAFL